MASPATRIAVFVIAAGLSQGCTDVRSFSGSWRGNILSEPALREGFEATATIDPLLIDNIGRGTVEATLTSNDGRFSNTRAQVVNKAAADALASMTFDGDPLRSFLLFAPLAKQSAGGPALLVLSLFEDDRLELRVIRGNDLFGVFTLQRQ